MYPAVKVCGLTQLADVRLAVRLRAWAVGFIFASSPRQMSAAGVARILKMLRATEQSEESKVSVGVENGPFAVGVFANAQAGAIVQAVMEAGLDAVQLHGVQGASAQEVQESLQGYMPPLHLLQPGSRRLSRAIVIQAVGVDPSANNIADLTRSIEEKRTGADLLLLDTKVGGISGGTGRSFSWELAAEAAKGLPYLVAGGIRPDNAQEALIRSNAWGIDVSSGIETSPGIKNHMTMRKLFEAVEKVSNKS